MKTILIVVLAVAVVALAGVVVYQNFIQPAANQPSTNQPQANSWKTFTDSDIGFSVSYPENWIVVSNTQGVLIKNLPVVDVVGNSGPVTKEGSIFSVNVNSMAKPQTIRELINNSDVPQADKQTMLNRIVTMNVAGENREVSTALLDVDWQSSVTFTVGKMSYKIGYMSGSPEQFQKDMPVFQKMLDSFKLTK